MEMLEFVKEQEEDDNESWRKPSREEPKWLENIFKERKGWGLSSLSIDSTTAVKDEEEEDDNEDDFIFIKERDECTQRTWCTRTPTPHPFI
jgi:hypothetical protein